MRSDTRVLNRQVVYLVRIHYVLLAGHTGTCVNSSVYSLVLGEFGAIAFVAQLAETRILRIICGLIHLVQSCVLVHGHLLVP